MRCQQNWGPSTPSFLSFPIPGSNLFGMSIHTLLASDDLLDNAHEWLCRRRRDYSASSNTRGMDQASREPFSWN
jgi:hypothetical protein